MFAQSAEILAVRCALSRGRRLARKN